VRLVTTFEKTRAEVDVENLHRSLRVVGFDYDFQTTSRFVAPAGQIVIVFGNDRESGQNRVPVSRAAKPSILADAKIETEFLRDRLYLVVFPRRLIHAHDFLEGDDVGIDLFQYFGNAFWPHTAIKSLALMNVVSCDPK